VDVDEGLAGRWRDGQATGLCNGHAEETQRLGKVVGSTRRELRCKRTEVMWSDMAQVARDERGDAIGGTMNGGQV
jgi:hypothetical protein